NLLKESTRHAATQHGIHDAEREPAGVCCSQALRADEQVDLLALARGEKQAVIGRRSSSTVIAARQWIRAATCGCATLRRARQRRVPTASGCVQRAEHHLDEAIMIHCPCCCNN